MPNIDLHQGSLRIVGALCTGLMLAAAPAQAADPAWPANGVQSTLGVRYWANWGRTAKNLYGATRATLNSRLTYGSLFGNSGEIFAGIVNDDLFVKGFIGVGTLNSGHLQDEDFPPGITPYSSTNSAQHSGSVGYATIDAGYYLANTQNYRVGGLIGYNYLREVTNAYGCTQTASNTAVCTPAISTATPVISQKNEWHSLRIGVNGEAHMGNWRLNGEAVALPYVLLTGQDSHLLRICANAGCFTGPVPEDGHGWGYQLQTVLSYQATPDLSVGLGARYWHMQTKGHTHFEGHIVGGGGIPQPLDWKTDIFGVTAQTSMHF